MYIDCNFPPYDVLMMINYKSFTEVRKILIIYVKIVFLWNVFINLTSKEGNRRNARQVLRSARIS
jgi:16S rRNA G527 N7-methylase RsmG